MIKEDYVSFETAKLLKEKGFDGGCRARYGTAGSFSYEKYEIESGGCEIHNAILAPTLQMAMKWLREVYNIDIVVFPHKRKRKTYYARVLRDFYIEHQQKCNAYISYEQACEAAIKYCLENLI